MALIKRDIPSYIDFMADYHTSNTAILEYVSVTQIRILAGFAVTIGAIAESKTFFFVDSNITMDWSDLDTGSEAIGTDYYVYVCANGGALIAKWSEASTYPSGFDANNSRKIGMFHNSPDGDILQYSIQDLDNRPKIGFAPGMVTHPALPLWGDIYLASDDGASGAVSVYGANYLDTIDYFDAVDRGAKVGKRLMWYHEFQAFAAGAPEEEDMNTEQHTTGGHSIPDGTGARVQSTVGMEDCAGVLRQWGLDQGYRYDGGGHVHVENEAASYTQSANTASTDPAPSWVWYNLPGGKGSIYKQGTYGITKITFGGDWDFSSGCGSRCAILYSYPWSATNSIGFRLVCESR